MLLPFNDTMFNNTSSNTYTETFKYYEPLSTYRIKERPMFNLFCWSAYISAFAFQYS
jgi:hypothetical protein